MKLLYGILLVLFLVGCAYQTPVNNNDNNNIVDNNDNTEEIKVTIVRSDLVSPWGIDELPDGSLLITQRTGQLLRLDGEQLIEIEADFSMVQVAGQGGLLDVLVDRDFEDTGYVFFTIAQNTGNTALVRAVLSDDNQLEEMEIIYRALPEFASDNHFGSRVVMDTEGNLFMSTGDRQVKSNRYRAQQLDNGHGKVLHMTKDGEPVQGSPWIEGADPLIYAYGLRNAQGLAYDSEHQMLYLSDMGPMGGDEINIIEAGHNYGWPLVSYGKEYSGSPIGDGLSELEGVTPPIVYWTPSIAPSGIAYYDSDVIEQWRGNLFVSALAGQHLVRLVIQEGEVIEQEQLLMDETERIRDVHVYSDGSLYVISDSGILYRIGY